MLNIGFEIVNLAEILAEKKRVDREKEIQKEAKKIHDERERVKKELEL
jgi:formiminotetrahydrofolate cyclodeaminase